MFLYITNKDSEHLYPDNSPTNFYVQLPHYMGLDHDNWVCTVLQCVLPDKPKAPVFVLADFVEPSYFDGRLQGVLCMTDVKSHNFYPGAPVPIKNIPLATLHIKLVNRRGVEPSMSGNVTLLLLKFSLQSCP